MNSHTRLHEVFIGDELKTAERIQHLRYLMLIHSRIYYKLNYNLISDKEFDALARELKELQNENPKISEQVDFAEAFADWDGTTGAFLPLDDEWVVRKTSLVFNKGASRRKNAPDNPENKQEKKQEQEPDSFLPESLSEEEKIEEQSFEDYQMSLEDLFSM